MKISKKNKEHYSITMYNKIYDMLTEKEKENVQLQYNKEHCILTEQDEQVLILEEEYGRSDVSKIFSTYYR